jgi:hypothetical protein
MGKHIPLKIFQNFLRQTTLAMTYGTIYTEENGISEYANRSIVERARAMLHDTDLPIRFWAKAVSTTIYLKNRSPTSALANGLSP